MPRRQPVAPTTTWQQLELRFTDPVQRLYELIRPVVLFGDSLTERAQHTGAVERTLYRYVERFTTQGMVGLLPHDTPTHMLPQYVRQIIVDLKAEHPPLRVHEIQTICYVRTGRRPHAKTIKHVLTTTPLPFRTTRRFPRYHQMTDPVERRRALIRLHMEGWTVTSIAEYLGVDRKTVYRTLKRWVEEGVNGLANKSSARRPGGRRVTLKTLRIVRHLQKNEGLGEFRMAAHLRQMGIHVSPRTCGRILALNRQLYGLPKPTHSSPEKQGMPYAASRRHQFWTVDVRYLDTGQYPGGQVYCISILENYSRAILSSAVSPKQDVTAFLRVFYAAVARFGTPEGFVSDGGSVFKAKQVMDIYRRLRIVKHQIAKRQAWQSYIETTWNIQRRMADYHFAQATTWPELQAIHQQWVHDYNAQMHWAHRKRDDGRRSPGEVVGTVVLRIYAPEDLHRIFYTTRFTRRLDAQGYLRFRHLTRLAQIGCGPVRTTSMQ